MWLIYLLPSRIREFSSASVLKVDITVGIVTRPGTETRGTEFDSRHRQHGLLDDIQKRCGPIQPSTYRELTTLSLGCKVAREASWALSSKKKVSSWISWPSKMGPMGFPGRSLKYLSTMRNIPEECRRHLHRDGSLLNNANLLTISPSALCYPNVSICDLSKFTITSDNFIPSSRQSYTSSIPKSRQDNSFWNASTPVFLNLCETAAR